MEFSSAGARLPHGKQHSLRSEMGQIGSKLLKAWRGEKPPIRSSPARPSSPPRGMASILETEETTSEFRDFLRDLDTDEDDNVSTRTDWLDFVLACRELHEATTEREQTAHAQSLLVKMGDKFFKPTSAHRVALPNPKLRPICEDLCVNQRRHGHTRLARHIDPEGLAALWEAHDDVVERLDELHQPFLVQRHKRNNSGGVVAEVISCLL